MLREITFDVTAGSSAKPGGEPAMPAGLPEVERKISSRSPAVTALAASPWAPLMAVSGWEQILFRHAASEETLGILPFPEGTIHDLKFSRNGSVLIASGGRGGESGKVVLFDVKSGKRIAEIGDEEDVVLAADLSADHRFVALGGPAKVVKIFDATNGKLLHRIEKHTDWITALAFAPEGDQLASADRSGGVHVWEAGTGGIVYTLDEHKVHVADLAWRADGKMLASGADDGKMVLWDMKDGWPSKVVDAHKGNTDDRYTRATGILSLAWSRGGSLITSGRDKRVRIWKADGNREWESEEMESLPITATLLSDSKTGWLGMYDGSVVATGME